MALSPAQMAQGRAAAPKGWLGYLRKVILAHPGDPDAAALHLSGAMRLAFGFRRTPAGGKTRGVTAAYILTKKAELGVMWPGEAA